MYSPIHKVRRNVGYLAYPRERKPQSRCVTLLHTIRAHMLPVPTEKCHNHELQQEASGLRERTVSLWVTAQRVQTLDEMLRAPPFAGPLGLCAHLSSLPQP